MIDWYQVSWIDADGKRIKKSFEYNIAVEMFNAKQKGKKQPRIKGPTNFLPYSGKIVCRKDDSNWIDIHATDSMHENLPHELPHT